MKQDAFICDIDGTVALHAGIRGHYEYDKVQLDNPNWNVINLVRILNGTYKTLFVSGRPDKSREETVLWLKKYDLPTYALYMRPDFLPDGKPDYRQDYIVKEEIYRNFIEPHYNIKFCLDDRNQVVRLWRSLGLTCLQVAEGSF